MKKILIVCRQPPYGNSLSREAIDIALAGSVFNQDLAILFLGDGVFQLLKHQNSEAIALKNHGKALSAFPLYGVDQIYVDTQSLDKRQLTSDDLLLDATFLKANEIPSFIDSFHVILNF